MIRLDAHQHFWRLARGDYGWLTPDLTPLHRDHEPADLRPQLDAAGVAATILVQAAPTEAETDFLLALAAEHAWIAGVVGWTDLSAPDAPARVRVLAARPKLKGLRPMLQDLADPDWILGPGVAPAVRAMQDEGLVLDALIRPAHLAAVDTLAGRFPDLAIVIDHGAKPVIPGGPDPAWAEAMRAIARRPNVCVKLSGLLTEAPAGAGADALRPFVKTLLAAFGAERLLWGSDWPVLRLAAEYSEWSMMTDILIADLADEAREAVRGGNAARVYGIAA